jgi:proteasome lid subunit RPN8/RPN11
MFSRVRVSKSALDHFRRRAREAYPLEIHAFLLGVVNSVNEIEVTDFRYPKEYKVQTDNHIQWTADEYAKLKERATALNKIIVGDIHSHPDWDAVMSEQDYKACILDSLSICGICSVMKDKKTRVRFWTPVSSLPCEIIYPT